MNRDVSFLTPILLFFHSVGSLSGWWDPSLVYSIKYTSSKGLSFAVHWQFLRYTYRGHEHASRREVLSSLVPTEIPSKLYLLSCTYGVRLCEMFLICTEEKIPIDHDLGVLPFWIFPWIHWCVLAIECIYGIASLILWWLEARQHFKCHIDFLGHLMSDLYKVP